MQSMFQKMCIGLVIVLLLTYMTKNMLLHPEKWQQAAFIGLKSKVQQTVTNLHWHWQQEGRPDVVTFKFVDGVRPTPYAMQHKMTKTGWPLFAWTDEGCREFVAKFVQPINPNMQLSIESTFISEQQNGKEHYLPKCRYTHKKYGSFDYLIAFGKVS